MDKKLLETKNKQIASARRIQQFWRDGRNRLKWKNTAEGLRNKQKEKLCKWCVVGNVRAGSSGQGLLYGIRIFLI